MNLTLAQQTAVFLDSKKACDILALNVAPLTSITDEMVIATGRSAVQVRALCDDLTDCLKEKGLAPLRQEGYNDGRWIVLDYGNMIVHLFHKDDREYYRLDRLWMDGQNELPLPFENENA